MCFQAFEDLPVPSENSNTVFPSETEAGGKWGDGQQGLPASSHVQKVGAGTHWRHISFSSLPQCLQLDLSSDPNKCLMNIIAPGASGWTMVCHTTWTCCRNSRAFLGRKQEAKQMYCCYWNQSNRFPTRRLVYLFKSARWLQECGSILCHLRKISFNAAVPASNLSFLVPILHVCFSDIFFFY